MNGPAIFLCTDPVGEHWQLGKVSSARACIVIIGWSGFPSIDAGVPEIVARVFARALCNLGTISFLASEIPKVLGHRVSSSPPYSVVALERRLGGTGSRYIVHTRDPDVALAAFEEPTAPWWLQGQMLLVTPPGGVLPQFTAPQQLRALLSDDWFEAARDLGLLVAARPGVDGDVVGLATPDTFGRETVVGTIGQEAGLANVSFDTVSESELVERLAN